jgi:hypothetical protein
MNKLAQKFSAEDDQINFDDEIKEFIDNKLIQEYTMLEVTPGYSRMKIILLEKTYITVRCTIDKGIIVILQNFDKELG